MPGWPWPDTDVRYVLDRAHRAFHCDPSGGPMAYRFLLDLAVGGFDDEPVRNLRAWVQRRPMEEFLALIVDNERRRVVRSETRTGWRRGDIIPLRTHMSWPQRTT